MKSDQVKVIYDPFYGSYVVDELPTDEVRITVNSTTPSAGIIGSYYALAGSDGETLRVHYIHIVTKGRAELALIDSVGTVDYFNLITATGNEKLIQAYHPLRPIYVAQGSLNVRYLSGAGSQVTVIIKALRRATDPDEIANPNLG